MTYSYELVNDDHFRVQDGNDNCVATCYAEENAKTVVAALNKASRLSALVLELAEAVDNAAADIGGSRPQLDILRDAVSVAQEK